MSFATSLRHGLAALAAGAFAALASTAEAHPGHDASNQLGFFEGLLHLVTESDHLALFAVAVAVALIARRQLRRHRSLED